MYAELIELFPNGYQLKAVENKIVSFISHNGKKFTEKIQDFLGEIVEGKK